MFGYFAAFVFGVSVFGPSPLPAFALEPDGACREVLPASDLVLAAFLGVGSISADGRFEIKGFDRP